MLSLGRNLLTLLSLVNAQTTLTPTATCVAPTSGLGESTTVQEVPDKNHKDIHKTDNSKLSHINSNLLPSASWCTFGAVSADALPDNELALPQHCPDKFPRAAADLDHLPGESHLLPQRALRIVVADFFSEPHLDGEKGNKTAVNQS